MFIIVLLHIPEGLVLRIVTGTHQLRPFHQAVPNAITDSNISTAKICYVSLMLVAGETLCIAEQLL